ncbi:MAG: YebC/PmpR family DNA-binding transcriptional regulator [Acidobacteria bacterium]|nr:MAG: YebC/PmpR family DNA-binding transcriptional regulator [Acidobacteriota bacterium]
MSGHSKWHSIKHKKGAIDAKRGRMFTKLIKEITIAARIGGGDQEGNPRLRKAIADAKDVNMPADNIKRAIQKGTGELEGGQLDELQYEGYGPGGVAMIVDVVTDNRNRTVSEIRHVFSKNGGNMGEAGSVSWMFHKKGYIAIDKSKADEDTLMALAIDAGADDFTSDESSYEIYTSPDVFDKVLNAVKAKGIQTITAEISMIPQNYIKVEGKTAQQLVKLMEALEEHDDVQHVYANFDIEESELAEAVS